ncbi:RZZ complex, subunit Zw10, partial [Dillenia turbinata]
GFISSMDVLFGSIDVRDLLSTSDFDPSAPLSAPDLRLLIDRLQVRSLHIKDKVRSYILSHHKDFSEIFFKCSESVSKFDEISNSISDLLNLISEHSIDAEIKETVVEIKNKSSELREKEELLKLVQVIANLNANLENVREELKYGRILSAAEAISDLKMALQVSDDAPEDGEPVVYRLLRKEWMNCFDEIQDVFVGFMEKAVRFDAERSRVCVKHLSTVNGVENVELSTVLQAMDVVGILDYGLAKVADLMIKHVISRAVNRASPVSFVEEVNQDTGKVFDLVLMQVPSSDGMVNLFTITSRNRILIENVDGEAIYSAIVQIIAFVYKYIFFQNGQYIRSFGRLTWPRMSDLIVANFLSKVVPDDASKLADFQKIKECTAEFEVKLKEFTFISSSDREDDRLTTFAENIEVHFASKKKTEILAKARNLLLRCDFVLPQGYSNKGPKLENDVGVEKSSDHVVDLLFLSERCTVSEAAIELMEIVHRTLKDVCLSSARVAVELYHAARDALLLYEVVIPIKVQKHLGVVNQVPVLVHNDMLYLSQEILGLKFEYRPDFPSSIKEHAVFIDLAPRLQLLAEEILQRQIQLICLNLKEAIDGADGFQNTHQKQQYESAKFSIDQVVVFSLEKVRIIWEPILPPSTYKRSMFMVLETVFSRAAKDILFLDDIAAEETLQLQRLIHLMLESLSPVFVSLSATNQESLGEEGPVHSLDELIPSLGKIHKLADLLDMPLKSITMAWKSGELISCGFLLSEIRDFIKAIFTDSPLRKECLWRIESAAL